MEGGYGFLKNQKFFEPYMIVVLVGWGLSLTQIGTPGALAHLRTSAPAHLRPACALEHAHSGAQSAHAWERARASAAA